MKKTLLLFILILLSTLTASAYVPDASVDACKSNIPLEWIGQYCCAG